MRARWSNRTLVSQERTSFFHPLVCSSVNSIAGAVRVARSNSNPHGLGQKFLITFLQQSNTSLFMRPVDFPS